MQKSYALFDFDGTLIRGDSIIAFCRYAQARGFCTSAHLRRAAGAAVRYGLHLISAKESKQVAMGFLAGRPSAEVDALARDFCREILLPAIRPQALEAIARHRASGAEVLLITASTPCYLMPLKASLGLTEIIGTRMDIDANGVYTGMICGNNCKGVEKPLRLAEYLAAMGDRLDYDSSWAYGDSASDAPMLRLCAHPVMVNPRGGLLRVGLPGAVTEHWNEPTETR